MIIDHIEFSVSDADKSRRFYEAALAPLGVACIVSLRPDQTQSGGIRHGLGRDG
ncbi:hypothetical protein [Chelativorans xinjiangense]|uniref:hypothetical protein n=1 Tax=Chelativorans xinjiangense TaxID=2681485 RepID=UPI0031B638B5